MTRYAKRVSALGLAVFLLGLTMGSCVSVAQQLLTSDSEKIDFAQGLLSQGQYTLAVSQFDEFMTQFPSSSFLPDAYLGAGEARFFLKEYDNALVVFEKYLAMFPEGKDRGSAQVRAGQIFYINGNNDASFKYLDKPNPESLPAQFRQTLHFFKGQILATENKREEAIAQLKLAAELADASSYTAQAYLKWGSLIVEADPAAALEKYTKALEKADTDELKSLIALRQGEAYYLQKDYDQAGAVFVKTMEANQGKPVMIDAMTNWYTVLLAQKNFTTMITQYNQQLKAVDKPEYFQVYVLTARALAASGNVDGALVMFDQILGLSGLSAKQKSDVFLQKTKVMFESGKFADIPAFVDGKLAEAADVKPALLMLKGKAYLNTKEYDKAWETFDQVTKESAQDPAAIHAVCAKGHVRFAQEKFDEAAGIFVDCLNQSQDPDLRQEAAFNAFSSYKKSGNEDKIVETAKQYLALTPAPEHRAQVAISLSGLYVKRQQFDLAREVLEPFVNDPDETARRNAAFQLAYILQSSGKMDEALSAYQSFISDGKNDRLTYLALKNSCMIYLQKKDEEKTAELMQKAMSEFSDNDFSLKSYLWLAEHWQSKNEAQKMLDVLAIAEKKYAKDPEISHVHFFKGQAYRMQENCKAAFENYDVVIQSDKAAIYKGRARLGKGICSTGLGDYAGAAKELEQAVVDSPDDIFVAMRARFALARNAELMKDFDLAAKLYLVVDVLYNDPEFAPKSLLRAAVILEEQLNNKTEATNAYNKILHMYPNSPEAQKAQEKVGLP